MRNKTKALFIMALCFCMVACAGVPSSGSAAALSSAYANSLLPGMKVFPLTPALGMANSLGYYYIDTRADFSYNIRYVDFATQLDIVLCNQPDCTHADETCGAWGAPDEAIPLLQVTDEKLYLLFPGGGWGYVEDGGKTYPGIDCMDLNGSNRSALFTAKANQLVGELNAMNEDVFLTFLYTTHQQGDTVVTDREVVTINRHTGHLEKLFSIVDMAEFVGVTESGMLWKRYVYDENSGYSTAYFRFLEEINLQTQEVRLIRQWEPEEPEPIFQNQYGFAITEGHGVERFDLQNGQATLLCSQYTNFSTTSPHLYQIFSDTLVITDVRWRDDEEMKDGQTLVNLHTGQTADTTLAYITGPEGGTYPLPVRIIAETDDQFLVMVGAEIKSVQYDDGSGNSTTLPYPVEEYAMIAKSDFWSNNPQYMPVTRLD